MLMLKSKRGDIFIITVVVLTIVLLGIISLIIYTADIRISDREEIGYFQTRLTGLYSKAGKMNFYLDKSLQYNFDEVIGELGENGGFYETAGKSKGGYVLWEWDKDCYPNEETFYDSLSKFLNEEINNDWRLVDYSEEGVGSSYETSYIDDSLFGSNVLESDYLKRYSEQKKAYLDKAFFIANKYDVPKLLVWSLIAQESDIKHCCSNKDGVHGDDCSPDYDEENCDPELILKSYDDSSLGIMQINKRVHSDCFSKSYSDRSSTSICKVEECRGTNAYNLDCNIAAGLKLLNNKYKEFETGCKNSALYKSLVDNPSEQSKYSTFWNACNNCKASNGVAYNEYVGWDASLRSYNGWACRDNIEANYVQDVRRRANTFIGVTNGAVESPENVEELNYIFTFDDSDGLKVKGQEVSIILEEEYEGSKIQYTFDANLLLKKDSNFDKFFEAVSKIKSTSGFCGNDLGCWDSNLGLNYVERDIDGNLYKFDIKLMIEDKLEIEKEVIFKGAIDYREFNSLLGDEPIC